MLSGALASQRVYDLSLALERRKTTKDSNKVVQKYGEIYGSVALRDIEEDIREEREVVNIRESRLTKPWKLKYKEVMKQLIAGDKYKAPKKRGRPANIVK